MRHEKVLSTTMSKAIWANGVVLLLALASSLFFARADARASTPGGNVGWTQTKGLDRACAPTLAQMQALWTGTPYYDFGVYIGGAERNCSPNGNLTASWVSQANDIGSVGNGWSFIPIWVGPQAPCSSYATKISTNLATADKQGRDEANAAATAAAALGFTTGTVIYYDIEAYDTSNSTCRNAVNTFLNAWDVQLREARGIHPAIYGSACGSAVQDWAYLANVPDIVWMANWNGVPSVWDQPCVANTSWAVQPPYGRLHQYSGPHDETWNGVTLDVDNDCDWGLVAPVGRGPLYYSNECPGVQP